VSPLGADVPRRAELDHLRFLAVGLMVINHVAVESPAFRDSWSVSAAGFLGSFAPVLFFHLTGLGYGLQSASRPARRGQGYLVKVAILLAADFDFFTFIGLSMFVLEWVRRAPRSGMVSVALAAALVAGRYVAGPAVHPWLAGRGWGLWVEYLLGTAVIPAVGYALSPWMVYPLLGFALGRFAGRKIEAVEAGRSRLPLALVTLAGVFAGLALVLASRGAVFFRYGTMSFAYFAASLALVLVSLAGALRLARVRAFPTLSRLTALSGLRSFAVVPLHYALVWLTAAVLGPAVGAFSFAWNALAVLVLSVAGSPVVGAVARVLDTPTRRRRTWIVVVGLVLAYRVWLKWRLGDSPLLFLRTTVQLSLCVLLALHRPPSTRPDRPRHAETHPAALPASA